MLAQYIIDWRYVRRIITDASEASQDAKLVNIRFRLYHLRSAIGENGVLFCDRENQAIRNLIKTKVYLKEADSHPSDPVWLAVRQGLLDELMAFQELYLQKCIHLDVRKPSSESVTTNEEESLFCALLTARENFIRKANLEKYNLPFAVITSRKNPKAFAMELEQYIGSSVERRRKRWQGVSFTKRDESEANDYWAALSVGASAFGEVQMFDPFCLSKVFEEPYSSPPKNSISSSSKKVLDDWEASIMHISSFFVRNSFVKKITFIAELETLVNCTVRLDKLNTYITTTIAKPPHRDRCLACAICAKKENSQWHNRWLDIGVAQCACADGFELYQQSKAGQIHIRKTFGIVVMGTNRKPERDEAQQYDCHSYNDLYGIIKRGSSKTKIQGFTLAEIKPPSNNLLASFTINPPQHYA